MQAMFCNIACMPFSEKDLHYNTMITRIVTCRTRTHFLGKQDLHYTTKLQETIICWTDFDFLNKNQLISLEEQDSLHYETRLLQNYYAGLGLLFLETEDLHYKIGLLQDDYMPDF